MQGTEESNDRQGPLSGPPDGELIDSINESAKHIGAISVTFLLTLVYLVISVASTTDEMLLLDSRVTLPLLDVGLPVRWFYFVAPALVLVLHLNLLLHEYLLARKVVRLKDDQIVDDALFFPSISIGRLMSGRYNFLIRLLFVFASGASLFVLPVATLILIYFRFIPFHHPRITPWDYACVLLDILLIWTFVGLLYFEKRKRGPSGWSRDGRARLLRTVSMIFLLVVSVRVLALLPSFFEKTDVCNSQRELFFFLPYRSNLYLHEQVLVAENPSPGMVTLYSKGNVDIEEVIRRKTRGLHLSRRNLACADFSGSSLINADFRGANLQGAIFNDVDLRGANFGPSGAPDRPLEEEGWEDGTVGTEFARARDQTKLTGAVFRNADLSHAIMTSAVLDDSSFEGAVLQEVRLVRAELRRANFNRAKMLGANLSGASMQAASLWRADLSLANLSSAKLDFAQFTEAKLQGVDFQRATAIGTDFRFASLQGAFGLLLVQADLREAKLWGVDFCHESRIDRTPLAFPYMSDLRGVDFSAPEWIEIAGRLKRDAQIPFLPSTMTRLGNAQKVKETCLAEIFVKDAPNMTNSYRLEQFRHRYLLYDINVHVSPMSGWPKPSLEKREYYKSLSRDLLQQACQNASFADGLTSRVSNKSGPPNEEWLEAIESEMRSEMRQLNPCEPLVNH